MNAIDRFDRTEPNMMHSADEDDEFYLVFS
jgi:hypothetical protein